MTDEKYYRSREFAKLQKEWYKKLEEDGFVDIEGGKDETAAKLAAKGHVKSVGLNTLRSYFPHTSREVKLDDILNAEHHLVQYQDSHKARYYRAATHIVAEGFRQGLEDKVLYVWQMCSEGLGSPTIQRRMWEDYSFDMTPREVHKLQTEFKIIVNEYLQTEEDGLDIEDDD